MRRPWDGGGRLFRRSSGLPLYRLPSSKVKTRNHEEDATKMSMPSMAMGWRLPGCGSSLLLAWLLTFDDVFFHYSKSSCWFGL